jgi:hypothetical protein
MKATRIRKLEEKMLANLPGRERVRMILEAGADGDRKAVRRLVETCPRKAYRMKEAEVAEPLDAARRLANAGVMIYDRTRHALRAVEAFQTAAGSGKGAAGKARADLLRGQRNSILEDWRAAWDAFDLLCRETFDLDGLTLITGIPLEGDWRLSENWRADVEKLIGEEIPEGTVGDRTRRKKLAKYWTKTLKEAFAGEAAV